MITIVDNTGGDFAGQSITLNRTNTDVRNCDYESDTILTIQSQPVIDGGDFEVYPCRMRSISAAQDDEMYLVRNDATNLLLDADEYAERQNGFAWRA